MSEGKQEEVPPKFLNAQYMGAEFKSKGVNKKGKDWKLYKTLWQVGEEEHTRPINMFSPLGGTKTKQLSDLEDGEMYSVGYNESTYEHPEHGTTNSRTGFFIGPAKEQKEPKPEAKEEVKPVVAKEPEAKVELSKVKGFVKMYKDNIVPDKRNKAHFIGSYILNNDPLTTEALGKVYDEDIKE